MPSPPGSPRGSADSTPAQSQAGSGPTATQSQRGGRSALAARPASVPSQTGGPSASASPSASAFSMQPFKTNVEHPKASTPEEFDEVERKIEGYYTLLGLQDALTDVNHPETKKVYYLLANNLGGDLALFAESYDNAAELYSALTSLCTQSHINNYQRNFNAFASFEVRPDESMLSAFTRLRRLYNHLKRAGDKLDDRRLTLTFLNGLRNLTDYTVECTILSNHSSRQQLHLTQQQPWA